MTKKLGCCSLCDREVFDSAERYPHDHALASQIRSPGAPAREARRVTFLLMDGSRCDMTFCSKCDPIPRAFVQIWEKVCRTMAGELDPDYRVAIGAGALDPAQRKVSEENLLRLFNNPPVGVLYEQPWSEVDGCPN
jgi:hypothetical protein